MQRRFIASLFILAFSLLPALAQNPGITRYGTIVPGNCVEWRSNTQVQDAGDVCGGTPPAVPVTSVFGRIGAVVAATNDYNFNQLAGNIAVSQMNSGTGATASTWWRGDGTWTSIAFSDLTGNIAVSQMDSGTNANATTFWRGDGTWQAIGGGTFIQAGTGAQTLTVQTGLRERISVKQFGATGNSSAVALSTVYANLAAAQVDYPFVTSLTQSLDYAATQAAINYAETIAAGGTVYFPGNIGSYQFSDGVTCHNTTRLAFEGDAHGTVITLANSGAGQTFFNCKPTVFRTNYLSFKNLVLTTTNNTAGSLAFDIENRQETIWDHVQVFNFREGIKLNAAWAPIVINGSYINGALGRAIYAADSSFKGARIIGNTFAGNGLTLNTCAVCVSPGEGVLISANDFATNYIHIDFPGGNSNAVTIIGNYMEDATLGSIAFTGTPNGGISIIGNTFENDGATSTAQNVTGLTFKNNLLYNSAWTFGATALGVESSGNILLSGATLGTPAYVPGTPLVYSSDITNVWRVLGKSGVQVSHTGNTTETAVATVTVPANAMGANGNLRITAQFSGTVNANIKTYRIRWNGAAGTQCIGADVTTSPVLRMQTEIVNRNSVSSQVCNNYLSLGGFGISAAGPVTATANTTSARDIVFTVQLANSADTARLENYLVELVN